MPKEHVWELNPGIVDRVSELAHQYENNLISEQDYIDKLRMLGFPRDAQPGDHVRMVVTKKVISAPEIPSIKELN